MLRVIVLKISIISYTPYFFLSETPGITLTWALEASVSTSIPANVRSLLYLFHPYTSALRTWVRLLLSITKIKPNKNLEKSIKEFIPIHRPQTSLSIQKYNIREWIFVFGSCQLLETHLCMIRFLRMDFVLLKWCVIKSWCQISVKWSNRLDTLSLKMGRGQ